MLSPVAQVCLFFFRAEMRTEAYLYELNPIYALSYWNYEK